MDMTPMVDLAFLLLTFFILTTTLRRLEGLELVLPLNGPSPKQSERTITFLVAGRDSIYAYVGPLDIGNDPPRRMGLDQVRAALHAVDDTAGLAISVRAHAGARYAGVVDVMDEVILAGLDRYSIADSLNTEEREALRLR